MKRSLTGLTCLLLAIPLSAGAVPTAGPPGRDTLTRLAAPFYYTYSDSGVLVTVTATLAPTFIHATMDVVEVGGDAVHADATSTYDLATGQITTISTAVNLLTGARYTNQDSTHVTIEGGLSSCSFWGTVACALGAGVIGGAAAAVCAAPMVGAPSCGVAGGAATAAIVAFCEITKCDPPKCEGDVQSTDRSGQSSSKPGNRVDTEYTVTCSTAMRIEMTNIVLMRQAWPAEDHPQFPPYARTCPNSNSCYFGIDAWNLPPGCYYGTFDWDAEWIHPETGLVSYFKGHEVGDRICFDAYGAAVAPPMFELAWT